MDLIKTTPDEQDCPLPSAYLIAASQATNPGLSWPEFIEVAKEVARTYQPVRGLKMNDDIDRFVTQVKLAARVALSKAKTEVILNPKSPKHEVVNGAHLFTGYDAPEEPWNPRGDGPSAA